MQKALMTWLALVVLTACKSGPPPAAPPAITAQELLVVEQGLTEFRLRLEGDVHSAGPARLERATYEFVVEGNVVGKGEQVMSTDVAPGQTARFSIEESSQYVKSAEELQAYNQRGGSLLVALRGTLYVRQGNTKIPLEFARSRQIRVPRLPSVKVHSMDGARYSSEEVNVQLALGVVNPNPFALQLDGLTYSLMLGGKPVGEGKLGAGEKVSASSTGVFEVAAALNTQSHGTEAQKLIKTRSIPYEIRGELKGKLYDVPYSLPGTLKLNVSR
jgi:LEA14-like dessication related protein